MYPLVLSLLLVTKSLAFFTSPTILINLVATPSAQQELEQLRLEKQIQKQVREEIDRTLSHIIFLLYLTLILALGLPLFSLGFYWLIQHKLTLELTSSIQSLAHLSQQLIDIKSSSQSNYQQQDQQDYQSTQHSDRSNLLANSQPDQILPLSKTLGQINNTLIPHPQDQEKPSNLPSIVATKQEIMQELVSHLPPLSQEKIFAGQEAKLTDLIQQLTILLKDYPNLPLTTEDYTNHAHALYFLEQDLAAIALYDHSLNLEPDQSSAWHQKGTIHLKKAEYSQAIAAYNQAINLQADYAPSWYKLAYTYALIGELDLALSHLQRAVNLNPIFRARARMSPDFEMLKQSDRFQSLVNLDSSL